MKKDMSRATDRQTLFVALVCLILALHHHACVTVNSSLSHLPIWWAWRCVPTVSAPILSQFHRFTHDSHMPVTVFIIPVVHIDNFHSSQYQHLDFSPTPVFFSWKIQCNSSYLSLLKEFNYVLYQFHLFLYNSPYCQIITFSYYQHYLAFG